MVKKCRHTKRGQNPRRCGCSWYADIYLDGKRRYVKLGADMAAARALYARIEADKYEGQVRLERIRRAGARATDFGRLTEDWLTQVELRGARSSTIAQYRVHVSRLREFFGETPVAAITETDVLEFLDAARRQKSPGYAKALWASLKQILGFAVEEGIIEYAPIPNRRVRFGKPREPRRLGLDEAERLIADMPDELRELAEFIYLTGLRIGEALALTPDHVQDGVVKVRATTTRGGAIGPPKTRTSVRDVVLSPRAQAIATSRISGSDRLWPWSYYQAQKQLARCVPKGVTWHTFRHANATLRAEASQDLRTQRDQLGHANMQMTMHYGRASKRDLANAKALDEARDA